MSNRERALTACYVAALVWLNAYWCRQVFFFDHIGQMNSMHGFWMGLARLAGDAWYKPTWWRYSYDGMPFEYTYAPLVPGLIAGISKLTGWSLGRAFGVVAGFVFCFGPVAMFLMARELSRRAGWSFVAVVTYCLFAPSQLFAPDETFSFRHLRDARRILLTFVWDEVPHELALAMVCLAVLFLVRGLRSRKTGSFVWAGVSMALALLANAFGATALLTMLLCLLVTWDTGSFKRNVGALTLCALGAYLAMSPFLPPTLLVLIGRNATNPYITSWDWGALGALLVVAGVSVGLWLLSRRWRPWYLRFFLLLAWVYTSIPVLNQRKLHFLPQPERYKVELEMWLILLLAFLVTGFADRMPRAVRMVVALLLLFPAAVQVRSHRQFAKAMIRSSDVRQSLEYQVANWLQANLPEGRVYAPGTIGQWMNAFTRQPQFVGGSFPTTPSVPIQLPITGITYLGKAQDVADWAMPWLKAYGVDAIVVPGRDSPEYWKPLFFTPEAFPGTLPLLWQERDTSIYSVPRLKGGLAHIIPETAIVRNEPHDFFDLSQVRAYVAALESANDAAEWRWVDDNHGHIRTRLGPGEVVSLQITYEPGWKAVTGGKAASITSDGLGQMVIHADCSGICEVDLDYDGGWEGKVLRILSLATILGVALWVVAGLRRRKVARVSTR
ncbi:MAG: hypothetical protein JWO19_969 [Bryobacterales bacterium]|nr:hypothetical protein [Bryobacterales bacterium]